MTTFEIILLSILVYFSGVILAAVFGAIVDAQDGITAKDKTIYICYASYFVAVILLVVLIARLLKFIPLKIYKYINEKFLCSH